MSHRDRPDGQGASDRGHPSSAPRRTPTVSVWKARPVFVSSTFRGMHAERDYLRDHGFPRLAERLRERCHHLDTIDLRQGVESAGDADEARREMQVLKVCLDEIERCKPFLVAMLGERYGWIPPAERIMAAARDAGLPETVEVAGRSVTELEILYAVLENPDQRRRSWFYFRTLDRTGMPAEVSARFPEEDPSDDPASPSHRLRALKERIRREMPNRVRDYTLRWDPDRGALGGLDELDRQVATDLWSDLDAETADYLRQAPRTWQEADARAVADFVVERTRGYVERQAITGPMLECALSPRPGRAWPWRRTKSDMAWGLFVTAQSGAGKSSLFGRVYGALQPRAESGRIVLLAHAAGIFPMSGQVDRMLRRWVSELAAILGRPDPLERPEQRGALGAEDPCHTTKTPGITVEEVDQAFTSLLSQVAARHRVVVLLDALNQFEPTVRAHHMTWLPRLWPVNARLIVTSIPSKAIDTLARRSSCRRLSVPPVTYAEAREIARRFYSERHHRNTNPRALKVLLTKRLPNGSPAHGNPLWLALALQEMNLLEADDFERADREYADLPGVERTQALQLDEARRLPADVPGVYGELLDRAERGFGKAWVKAFMGLLATGRAGYREGDLRELMPTVSGQPWDELAFADVRRVLGTHVVQRGAQAQWDFFHAALRKTVLGRYLADATERRRMHGLIADHLHDLPPSDPLRISESMVHLLGFGDRDRAAEYLASIQLLQAANPDAKAALEAAVTVMVEALQSAADDAARERLTGWIADLLAVENNNRAGSVASMLITDFSDALAVTGEVTTEQPRFQLLQEARRKLECLAAADASNVDWLRGLSKSHLKIGDALMVRGDLAGALKEYRESLSVAECLAARDPSFADWQQDLSRSHFKVGDVLLAQGNLSDALTAYRESLSVAERLAAADPSNLSWQHDLAVSYARIGDLKMAQGDLAGALGAYRESLCVAERLALVDPSNADWQRDLAVSHSKIGDGLWAKGDFAGALQAYRESLGVVERVAENDPSNARWQHDLSRLQGQIGDVLLTGGDDAGALKAYRETEMTIARLTTADPSNLSWQHDLAMSYARIGDLQMAQGDLAGALGYYRKSLRIIERLTKTDPSNSLWQRSLAVYHGRVGNLLRAQGDLIRATEAHRESVRAMQRIAARDPSHLDRQHDLAVGHGNVGDLLLDRGDHAGALAAYRKSLSIFEHLAQTDPANVIWQLALVLGYVRMADIAEEVSPDYAGPWWRKAGEWLAGTKSRRTEKTKQEDAVVWWRRAYVEISAMRQRGIVLPVKEHELEQLRRKIGG